MPSDFPRSPKFLKGALVVYETPFLGVVPNVLVFQYNPEKLSRTLTHWAGTADSRKAGGAKEETLLVKGPPVETISLTVELDAADQLDEPERHPHIQLRGLHPALAAMELLLYPRQSQILLNQTLAKAGKAQISAEKVPLVLFIWGPARVLPVRLASF